MSSNKDKVRMIILKVINQGFRRAVKIHRKTIVNKNKNIRNKIMKTRIQSKLNKTIIMYLETNDLSNP